MQILKIERVIVYPLMFCMCFVALSVSAQNREFRTADNYVERRDMPGSGPWERFFAIGLNLNGWINSTDTYALTEQEFTTAREIFNVAVLRDHPDLHDTTSFRPYLRSGPDDELIFSGGHDLLHWRLRSNDLTNENNHQDSTLGPGDQDSLDVVMANPANNMEPFAPGVVIEDLEDKFFDRGDFIYFMPDEPERAYESWAYTGDALGLYNPEIHTRNSLSYISLGPITGNHILYSGVTPIDTLPEYGNIYHQSHTISLGGVQIPDYERNVQETAREYEAAADIVGLNSYVETVADPFRQGNIVEWLLDETNRPVWPWISAEFGKRYTGFSLSAMQSNMREQAYSAIAAQAAGVFFWAEPGAETGSDIDRRWDYFLDVAREIKLHKEIIEQGTSVAGGYSGTFLLRGVRWRTFNLNDDERFLYAVNHNSNSRTIDVFWGDNSQDVTIPGNTSNVWIREGTSIRALDALRNLGFESNTWDTSFPPEGNWNRYHDNNKGTTTWIGLVTDGGTAAKTGNFCLKLQDDTDTLHCAAEQMFDCVPGGQYRIRAFYRHSSGSPQRLHMQFYRSNNTFIEEVKLNTHQNTNWDYVAGINPISLTGWAPVDATKIKISLSTGAAANISSGYWDDIVVEMIDYNPVPPANKSGFSPKPVEHKPFVVEMKIYPSPANPSTNILLTLPKAAEVSLKIYSINGQIVKDFGIGSYAEGETIISWDGRNSRGLSVSSGQYIVQLSTGSTQLVEKILLVR